jgi:hypothetical protein
MRRRGPVRRAALLGALSLGLAAAAHPLAAQAVSEWRTAAGLPVAIVELAGGDVEHFAALVPAAATLPGTVAGWSTASVPRPGALLWSLQVPAAAAPAAASGLADAVVATGCAAFVAVGPVPARELEPLLATLASVAAPAAVQPRCVLADGRVEVVRGTEERVELALAVPQPDDSRFDTLPAVAALLERRLATSLPGVRVGFELHQGCWRLLARLGVGDEPVRAVLGRLREAIAASVAAPVTEAEMAAIGAPLRRGAVAQSSDGGALAAQVVERLAQRGSAASALVPVVPGPVALQALLDEVAAGRAGEAVLVEAERRSRSEAPETLANGVLLSVRWQAEEAGVVAVALGATDPAAGEAVLAALATQLISGGWSVHAAVVVGVPVLTVVAPPGDLPAILETIADGVVAPTERPTAGLADDVAAALGLHQKPSAESLSLAIALPPESEVGVEAARKFFSPIPAAGVRSTATPTGPRLVWAPANTPPRLAAVVELPATLGGLLAGTVVARRAAGEPSLRTSWMAPAGALALALFAEGGESVPSLDASMAATWARLRRPLGQGELDAASRALFGELFGDLPAAEARAAVAPFLPTMPEAAAMLAPDAAEVSGVLAALPGWDRLLRLASGAAPIAPTPPVRKSPRH